MKKIYFVLSVVVVLSLLFTTTACKKTYDIRGTWSITYNWGANNVKVAGVLDKAEEGKVYGTGTITFSGNKTSGTFIDSYGDAGKWTVDGDKIEFTYDGYNTTYTGTLKDENNMSGTMTEVYNGVNYNGTWSATRQ